MFRKRIRCYTIVGLNYAIDKKEVLFHLNNNQYLLADGVALAPRLSPQLVGMGLLDLVSESTILEYEDINDSDMNGISGRANQQGECIGRFGWKAIHCTLKGQVAGAFQQDMGLTTTLKAHRHFDFLYKVLSH